MEWALIMAMSDPDISKFSSDIVEQVTSMFRAPDPYYQDPPVKNYYLDGQINHVINYGQFSQPYYSGYNYGVCTTTG